MTNEVVQAIVNPEVPLERPHFGIRISPQGLELPGRFAALAARHRINTATRLLTALELAPRDFAMEFGWLQVDVDRAGRELISLLNQWYPRTPAWGFVDRGYRTTTGVAPLGPDRLAARRGA